MRSVGTPLKLLAVSILLGLVACAGPEKPEEIDRDKLALTLSPTSFAELPGWERDDQAQVLAAFSATCNRILKRNPADAFGPIGGTYGDWQPACREAANVPPGQARAFFEKWFTPHLAAFEDGETEGLFTGYYEPTLRGSPRCEGPYQHPLYARPDDLVMVDLGEFREDLKGQRIAGRVKGAHLKPYEDRAAIEAGNWPHNDKVLVWVDDPVDSFFLHIQGSGRVEFADGTSMRVGYDGQNGHVYYAVGRELVKRNILPKEQVSLQSIKAWLEANPGEAQEFMNLNRSYVFFKELGEDGPQGGEGVTLTPERSLAIDHSKIAYGIPVFVDIAAPVDGEDKLQRLMIAQDTGGAIRGAVRGDVFWGPGDRAEHIAGMMKSKGRYWLLLPRSL